MMLGLKGLKHWSEYVSSLDSLKNKVIHYVLLHHLITFFGNPEPECWLFHADEV